MVESTLYYISIVNYLYERRKCYSLSCTILCDPMNCSPLGSSVHGVLQARILVSVAIPFSRGSSWPRGRTQVFYTACRFSTDWATREAQINSILQFENLLTILLKPGSSCVVDASHRSSQIHDLINFNCGTTTLSPLGLWSDVRKTAMTSVTGS